NAPQAPLSAYIASTLRHLHGRISPDDDYSVVTIVVTTRERTAPTDSTPSVADMGAHVLYVPDCCAHTRGQRLLRLFPNAHLPTAGGGEGGGRGVAALWPRKGAGRPQKLRKTQERRVFSVDQRQGPPPIWI